MLTVLLKGFFNGSIPPLGFKTEEVPIPGNRAEKGLLSLDSTLTERAHKLKARREAILIEIAGIKREQEIPLKMISDKHVDGFCTALKAKLFDKASNFGKEYLKLPVDEIRVSGKADKHPGQLLSTGARLKHKKTGQP